MNTPPQLDRVLLAQHAVTAYRKRYPCYFKTCLSQLLCDLMHYADYLGMDFETALVCARLYRDIRPPDTRLR